MSYYDDPTEVTLSTGPSDRPGWLAPDGTYLTGQHGTGVTAAHAPLARAILHSHGVDVRRMSDTDVFETLLVKQGYCRVDTEDVYPTGGDLTPDQRATLLRLLPVVDELTAASIRRALKLTAPEPSGAGRVREAAGDGWQRVTEADGTVWMRDLRAPEVTPLRECAGGGVIAYYCRGHLGTHEFRHALRQHLNEEGAFGERTPDLRGMRRTWVRCVPFPPSSDEAGGYYLHPATPGRRGAFAVTTVDL